ncbi:MAG TPA: DUF262 domain-containing HNH endonuclease family protein [Ignavibacteria bacterium]|nr:hypothetical protein [Bacteroidota bacterium]HRE11070.1 DUF262 domain-containing HNH endonuclease family protein [Ignavibacteria bacterium]HRF64941.1 DUF262 domain-containing HNH endonuclease family protein [Ignavibacteria bacterium]
MSEKLNFEAKDKKTEDILFSNNYFKIPRYQRPYSWTEDQILEFWIDLTNNDKSFFIGSFIFNHELDKSEGHIEVIDGQQRMLTLTIFIAILRDLAKTLNDDKTADRFQRQCIIFEDKKGNQLYRIKTGETTRDFFEKYIQSGNNDISKSEPKTKEEIRLRTNYSVLYEKVYTNFKEKSTKEKQIAYLQDLREKAGELIVIDIKIQSEEDAYEIFETTNARGVELSVADLLKNLIFNKIKEKGGKDIAKEMWLEIEKNVEETGTEIKKFIRYFWLSKYSFVTEKKLFKEIKKEIKDWDTFIVDLHSASVMYNLLLEGTVEDWAKYTKGVDIHRSIFAIRLMDVSQCFVLFLSIMRNFDKIKTDPTRVFQLVEKFTFNYSSICKLPGNKVEKIYTKYATQIEKIVNEESEKKIPGKIQSNFYSLERDLKDEKPSLELFKENFKEVYYANSEKSRKLIKYIFEELAKLKSSGEHKIDFNTVNIEHLLPQTPSKEWKLSKKEIKGYVNLIGNLTLVHKKYNSSIGNKTIKEKLPELEKSEISITSELVLKFKKDGCEWGEEQINQRQLEIADIAYTKIWMF